MEEHNWKSLLETTKAPKAPSGFKNDILNKMILEGEENKLSEAFILKIYKAIHQESINHQNKVITKK